MKNIIEGGNMISKRAVSIDSSGIRRVFDLASKIEDPINLSIGQPDFDAWDSLKAGAIAATNSGKNGYTVTQGIPELRQKIAGQYGVTQGSGYSVMLTSGVSGGVLLAYMSVLDAGDEIIIPDPYFCIYRDLAKLINATPKYYDTYDNFSVDPKRIEAEITSKTRAIVVASPANPTGYALRQEELDQIIEIARQHRLWLIFDEIYSKFCMDREHVECFGRYQQTIILNGFSKSHAVPGWRIGYALGPEEVITEMQKLQQYTFVCAPSFAQWGVLSGFEVDFKPRLEEYRRKRDFLYSELSPLYEIEKPGGAFYLFPKAPGGNGQKFIEKCIERKLLVVPGNVFSRQDTHFRISFSAPMRQLERGVEVLKGLL